MLNWFKRCRLSNTPPPRAAVEVPREVERTEVAPLDEKAVQERLRILMAALKGVPEDEALDMILNRRQKCDPGAPNELCVIIDTCFLMLDKMPSWWDDLLRLLQSSPLERRLIVPVEVADELRTHMGNEDKSQLARVARKRFAHLVELGCEEPSLSGMQDEAQADALGADSPTDRKLIALGASLADSASVCKVFIATDDGGIMLDVARLQRQGVPISTITKETQRITVLEALFASLARTAPTLLAAMKE